MRLLVRLRLLALAGVLQAGILPAPGDGPVASPPPAVSEAPQENVAKEFSGSGTTTTPFFNVRRQWEVRWNSLKVLSVAVMAKDGTIVAGASGVLRGSLYVPLGGLYYLQVSDGTHPAPVALPPRPAPAPLPAPPRIPFAPIAPAPTPTALPPSAPPVNAGPISWHLQVVELGSTAPPDQSLTVYTPYFTKPDAAVIPIPPPPPVPVLSNEEALSVVKIKGDRSEGAGFFLRTSDGTFVVTHLQLLADNPNLTVMTWAGAPVPVLGLRGSLNRDLALLIVQDDHFTYLSPPAPPRDKADSGDPLVIPDLGGPSDPLLGKAGRIIGITPERVDFDNGVDRECIGAPIILARTGASLAIVTPARNIDLTPELAQAWPGNPLPGASRIIPFFGIRLMNSLTWEDYDLKQFETETAFLRDFHHTTRCLDSFLNSRRKRPSDDPEAGVPDIHYFQTNPKLQSAFNSYHQYANGADRNQLLQATRELLFDLEGVAATDVATLQGLTNLYAYDRLRAAEELAYRKAIREELDGLKDNLPHLDDIARSR